MSTIDELLNNAKNGEFDEILAKTKDYAQRATRKSAERLEVSKKKIELLDSKTKLAKAYEKYGRVMYRVHLGEEVKEEEIQSSLAQIQLHKTRADLLDEELGELRKVFSEPPKSEEAETVEVEIVEVENDE